METEHESERSKEKTLKTYVEDITLLGEGRLFFTTVNLA